MQDPVCGLPRTLFLSTSVNKGEKRRRGQEAVRECTRRRSRRTVAKPSSQRLIPLDVSPSSSCRCAAHAGSNACGADGSRCGGSVSCACYNCDYENPRSPFLHLLSE